MGKATIRLWKNSNCCAQDACDMTQDNEYDLVEIIMDNGIDITDEVCDDDMSFAEPFYQYFIRNAYTGSDIAQNIVNRMISDEKVELETVFEALQRWYESIDKYKVLDRVKKFQGKFHDYFDYFSPVIDACIENFEFELALKFFKALLEKGAEMTWDSWYKLLDSYFDLPENEYFKKIMDLFVRFDAKFASDPKFITLLLEQDDGEDYLEYALTHGGTVPENIENFSDRAKEIIDNVPRYNPNMFQYLSEEKQEQIQTIYTIREIAEANGLNMLPRELVNEIVSYMV